MLFETLFNEKASREDILNMCIYMFTPVAGLVAHRPIVDRQNSQQHPTKKIQEYAHEKMPCIISHQGNAD